MCVFMLVVMLNVFVSPQGFLGVSWEAGGTNISAYGRETELTFALCGLFTPYLAIAGPTLWN